MFATSPPHIKKCRFVDQKTNSSLVSLSNIILQLESFTITLHVYHCNVLSIDTPHEVTVTMVTDVGVQYDVSGMVYHINNDLYRQSRSHTPPR